MVNNSIKFANFYKLRRGEAYESIAEAKTTLIQIKNKNIKKIQRVVIRNRNLRRWNEYCNEIVKFESELKHIDDVVIKSASEVDKKFNTNMIEIINNLPREPVSRLLGVLFFCGG
jgi:hypothetical protein